jgi:hypothetical protein
MLLDLPGMIAVAAAIYIARDPMPAELSPADTIFLNTALFGTSGLVWAGIVYFPGRPLDSRPSMRSRRAHEAVAPDYASNTSLLFQAGSGTGTALELTAVACTAPPTAVYRNRRMNCSA